MPEEIDLVPELRQIVALMLRGINPLRVGELLLRADMEIERLQEKVDCLEMDLLSVKQV